MKNKVINYCTPHMEVMELYAEGVLCVSGDNEKLDPDHGGEIFPGN